MVHNTYANGDLSTLQSPVFKTNDRDIWDSDTDSSQISWSCSESEPDFHAPDDSEPAPRPQIERLPTELLQRVFLYTLPRLPHPYFTEIISDFEETDGDAQHINLARLGLTHVCRSWRSVVLGTTQLWTTIAIDRPFPRDFENAKQWFENAGARALDISFDPQLFSLYPSELTGLLRENMSRIRCFLTSFDIIDTSILPEIFPPATAIEAPLLEALRLCCGYDHKPIGRINAPHLVHFHKNTIADTHQFLTPTPTLRTYVGAGTSLSFVTQCTNVTELHLHLDHFITHYPTNHVVLPAVRVLCLVPHLGLTNSCIRRFVEYARIPYLTSLEVWMNESADFTRCGILLTVVAQHYGANLQHLEVGCADFNGVVAKETFFNLPHLRTFALFRCTLREWVSDAMTPRPSTESRLRISWPCPELSELKLVNCTVLPCFNLVRLVRKRTAPTRAGGSAPSRLNSLVVIGCFGTDMDADELNKLSKTRNFNLVYQSCHQRV